jgi:DNA-binding response OmpR family regulator
MHFEKPIIFRIFASVLLAGAALGLYVMNQTTLTSPPVSPEEQLAKTLAQIDREIDTVLTHFGIEPSWMKKQQVTVSNNVVIRTERRVMIPPDVLTVQVNATLNSMMRHYGGRAVATENLKENTVTIHLKLQDQIVQTVVLKVNKELKSRKSNAHKKV